MLTRAFGSQLDEHAREDAYASAWAASLSALGERIDGMTDGELHNYIFSAVTTHAGKELRRRGRKPIDELDGAEAAGEEDDGPAESVVRRENERVLRDVLASLPERRRRVITLRYAIGLTPEEICEVVEGLSLRAYRKEINRGVKDLAARLALVETGEWCDHLAGQIDAFARGEATLAVQERARVHLAHCSACSRAVRDLAGSLHDLSLLPAAGLLAGTNVTGGGELEPISGIFERVKGVFGSVTAKASDGESLVGSFASSGGTRGGATALFAGAGAKIGALGFAGKVALGCVTATAGLATCVATGVVPANAVDRLLPGEDAADRPQEAGAAQAPEPASILDSGVIIPGNGDQGERTSPDPKPDASAASGPDSANDSLEPEPVIAPETATPVERESSPEVAATTSGSGASGGGSREAPRRADADQAAAQLGTP